MNSKAVQHGTPGEWARVRGTVLAMWPLFLSCALVGAFATACILGNMRELFAVALIAALVLATWSLRHGLKCVERYFIGARGEERVGRILASLSAEYHVFHDFVAGGHHVDHVLVGPTGVFAIETKNWRENVYWEDGHLIVGGRLPSRSPSRQAISEADAVQKELRSRGINDINVRAIVCFASNTMKPEFTETDGVLYINVTMFVDWLDKQNTVLNASQVARLVASIS